MDKYILTSETPESFLNVITAFNKNGIKYWVDYEHMSVHFTEISIVYGKISQNFFSKNNIILDKNHNRLSIRPNFYVDNYELINLPGPFDSQYKNSKWCYKKLKDLSKKSKLYYVSNFQTIKTDKSAYYFTEFIFRKRKLSNIIFTDGIKAIFDEDLKYKLDFSKLNISLSLVLEQVGSRIEFVNYHKETIDMIINTLFV